MQGSTLDDSPPQALDWLIGGGAMGDLIRDTDWATTLLGPRRDWPLSLRTAVSLVLESRVPMALLWGRDLLLLYNDAYRDIAADKHPRALGRPTREVWPDVWHINEPIFAAVMERGESIYHEDELFPIERHGRREEAFFTLCYSPVRGDDTAIAGALVTLLETTGRVREQRTLAAARARAEAAAQRERELYARVADRIPVMMATYDPALHSFHLNAELRRVLGWTDEDSRIGDLMQLCYPDPAYRAEVERFMDSPDSGWRELEVTAKDGTRVVSAWANVRISDDTRVGIGLDLRERKHAESLLREADRKKTEFLAMLSHELRNPLAPIGNSLYILGRAAPGSEQAKRSLAVIDRQVHHMTRLIDDLLDVTRISRGKIRLQRESLDLNELVRATGEDLRELFRRNHIDLDIAVSEQPLRAQVDRTRIAQVIGNLLHNAAKFTPEGGRVCLSVAACDDGHSAVIAVRDDGAGMLPETVDKLFEPFMQADQTLDRSRGGLGLGLALVKGLTELHGGTVSAASAGPGQGATFKVGLPLAEAVRPQLSVISDTATASRALRILVIEDNVDTASSLKELLELSGHTVEMALTGLEGLRKARALEPDLVLCDIGLPQLDGYGVARALRADPRLRRAFLVALSGYALQEDIDRSTDAGFDRHLAKPPSIEALEAVVAETPSGSP